MVKHNHRINCEAKDARQRLEMVVSVFVFSMDGDMESIKQTEAFVSCLSTPPMLVQAAETLD